MAEFSEDFNLLSEVKNVLVVLSTLGDEFDCDCLEAALFSSFPYFAERAFSDEFKESVVANELVGFGCGRR